MDLLCAIAERVVDLAAKLVAHDEKDDERRDDDRERNRRCRDDRQSAAEGHGSRSA
jgi:hypothetical protein